MKENQKAIVIRECYYGQLLDEIKEEIDSVQLIVISNPENILSNSIPIFSCSKIECYKGEKLIATCPFSLYLLNIGVSKAKKVYYPYDPFNIDSEPIMEDTELYCRGASHQKHFKDKLGLDFKIAKLKEVL